MGSGLEALNILEPKTLADMIYDAVRAAIVSGELAAGSRLRETDLAGKMHVSRTPVREALCRLESEGIIEYIPRRGMVIRRVSEQETGELFAIRTALEPLAAELAAVHLRPEQLKKLATLLQAMQAAAVQGRGRSVYMESRQFDDLLLHVAGLPVLAGMVNTCRERLLHCRRDADLTLAGNAERALLLRQVRQYMDLFRALQARDGKQAGQRRKEALDTEREVYLISGGEASSLRAGESGKSD